MTRTDHLAKARDYIAKGEDYYRKAAEEIKAAMDADSTLSYRDVGARIGRNESYARRLVKSLTSAPRAADGPLTVEWASGTNKREEVVAGVIRERPEVIADAIDAAPSAVKKEIAYALKDTQVGESIRRWDQSERRALDADLGRRERDHIEPPRADWSTITGRCYAARRGFEQSLSELKALGRAQLSDEVADDLLDTVERTIAAGELLASFLKGKDMLSEIESFLAEVA